MTAVRLACALALTAGTAAAQEPPRPDRHGDPLPPGAIARLGTVRFRHPGAVHAVAFSPDGRRLAASSDDKDMFVVWDRATGKKVCEVLLRDRHHPTRLAFSADGKRVLAGFGAADNHLPWAWDATTGAPAELPAPPAGTRLLAFPPRGRELLLFHRERQVVRWDVEKDETRGGGAASLRSPVAALLGDRLLVAGHEADLISVRDLARPDPLWSVPAAREKNYGPPPPAFSPDGTLLAASPQPRAVRVYDAVTGKVVREPEMDGDKSYYSLAISPDKETLAGSNWDGSLRLWSVDDGTEAARVRAVPGHTTHVFFAPDSKSFATGGGNNAHGVMLWDTATGRPIEPYPSHASPVTSVAFAPDGRLVATSSWMRGDPLVRLWEPDTGKLVRTLDAGVPAGVTAVAFSPNGRSLAGGTWYGDKAVRVWDVGTGAVRHVLRGHKGACLCVAYSPDGKRIASGDVSESAERDPGRVRVWDAETGALVREIGGHRGTVTRVQFTPDGKHLLAAAGAVHVYDAESGRAVGDPIPAKAWGMAVSPDSRFVATASDSSPVRLWNLTTRVAVEWGTPPGTSIDVAFAPDGRSLAVRGAKGAATVVRVPSGERVASFDGTPGQTRYVFSPDGRLLVTAGNEDSSALVWEVHPSGVGR